MNKKIIYGIAIVGLILLSGCECPECIETECEPVKYNCPVDKPINTLKVYFINVGHGDSQLIKYGNTEMLIDCGKNAMGPTVVDFLKGKNIKRIEYLMITHPDLDNLGGCDDVLKSIQVQTVITNGETVDSGSYREVMGEIDTEQLINAKVSDNWNIGPANIEILQTNNNYGTPDENSLVSKLTYGRNSILFTGGCSNKCEDFLLEKNITADILVVANHGTNYATGIDFLEKVNPSIAIIQTGVNDYGHPASETLDRLSQEGVQVYRTDQNGMIEIDFNGESYEVK